MQCPTDSKRESPTKIPGPPLPQPRERRFQDLGYEVLEVDQGPKPLALRVRIPKNRRLISQTPTRLLPSSRKLDTVPEQGTALGTELGASNPDYRCNFPVKFEHLKNLNLC